MNDIKYWEPVGIAWRQMVSILFRPFELEKWMVMGFAAWIGGTNLGGGGSFSGSDAYSREDLACGQESFAAFWAEHGILIISIGAAILALIIIIGVVFAWLHARGRFIFLDNVIQNRGAIVEPWKKYRVQGNSLFLWNIAVGTIALLIFLLLAGVCFAMIWPMTNDRSYLPLGIAGILIGSVTFFIYCLFFGYLGAFVYDFVVPLMLKHNLRIRATWSVFGPLLRQNIGSFLLYGLVRYLISIATHFAYLAVCLATCCCFLFITIIPYIGTVLLLPVYVFIRLIGIEFLRQFGDEFRISPLPDMEASESDELPATLPAADI